MTAAIRAGAPPGGNENAALARGVWNWAWQRKSEWNLSSIWPTSRARWAAFVGAFRPLRLVRRWVGVLS